MTNVLYGDIIKTIKGNERVPKQKGVTTMKIISETSLANFEFWSGAKDTANRIWEEKGREGFDQLEAILEDMYPDGIDETELNDLLWFDAETVYEWLGIGDEDENENEEEEAAE